MISDFSESDLAYLQDELEYKEDFINYLREVRFTGDVYSMVEGEFVFANEPIIRIEAPLVEAQLIETALLNIVNYQTLIATKASRIKQIVKTDTVMEFGTRRAQEMDAAIWGCTCCRLLVGLKQRVMYGQAKNSVFLLQGLMPIHSFKHIKVNMKLFMHMQNVIKIVYSLVDTYNTLKIGVPTAIQVAKELGDKINFVGIRLDSGDIAFLSKEARTNAR